MNEVIIYIIINNIRDLKKYLMKRLEIEDKDFSYFTYQYDRYVVGIKYCKDYFEIYKLDDNHKLKELIKKIEW